MTQGSDAAKKVIEAFDSIGIEYMLVGSFSSNYYGIPRSTQDADFVAVLSNKETLQLADYLGEPFKLDPQPSFESVTGTFREIFLVPSIPFKIEIFRLSTDEHDKMRFKRKVRVTDDLMGGMVWIPTAEDVIITKLRWAEGAQRGKDSDDVRNIIAVQDEFLNWEYVFDWAERHQTSTLLQEIRNQLG